LNLFSRVEETLRCTAVRVRKPEFAMTVVLMILLFYLFARVHLIRFRQSAHFELV